MGKRGQFFLAMDPSVVHPDGADAYFDAMEDLVSQVRAADVLPDQGPIGVFVHHNTLHAFEDLRFDDAVKMGAKIFGCHPYLPEDRYRERVFHSL